MTNDSESLAAKSKPKSVSAKKPKTPNTKRQTKASRVEAMLRRKTGATLEQITKATEWQPHTCRAFLTGLRKKGQTIRRDQNDKGKSVYRIESATVAAES